MTWRSRSKSPWYTRSRKGQEKWKATTSMIPDSARERGTCFVEENGERKEVGPFPICLPVEYADLNLLASVRDNALARFSKHDIEWHSWTPGPEGACWPSTHLLDSQVQCVNVLLSLAAKPELLLDLVRQVEPTAVELLEVEDGSPVAFEWIGAEDYLGERPGLPRHRGRFTTSADALVVLLREDGGKTSLIIEWKFTETYNRPIPFISSRGTDRRKRYQGLYEAQDSPFAERPDIDGFFHEPHYQLLRQALLAHCMVKAGELGVDRAVLLHLVPAMNRTLRTTVPQGLKHLGGEVDEVWHRLLPGPAVTYACLDTMPLIRATPELEERYGSLGE